VWQQHDCHEIRYLQSGGSTLLQAVACSRKLMSSRRLLANDDEGIPMTLGPCYYSCKEWHSVLWFSLLPCVCIHVPDLIAGQGMGAYCEVITNAVLETDKRPQKLNNNLILPSSP
jgi:hypothetical protein